MKKQFLFMMVLLLVALSGWGQTTRNVPSTYSTIQAAINAAAPGDIIQVAAGTYTEALLIQTPLTINGPNAAVSPNGGSRVAEAIIDLTGGSQIKIRTDNLNLKGFKIVNLNQQGAIVSGGSISNTSASNNVTIEKNLFDNLTGNAIYTYGSISNWTITDNKIQNVSWYSAGATGYGSAMGFWINAAGLTVTNNTISNVAWEGIQLVCWGPSTSNTSIQNNTITNVAHSGMNIASSLNNVDILGNTITNANTSTTPNEGGIIIQGLGTVVDAVISGNTISGSYNGIYVQDNLTGKDLVVNNNDLSGNANKAIKNDATGTLAATCNWFGTIVPATIAGMISGSVTYIPYNVTSSGPCVGGLPVLVKRSGVIINGYSTIQAAINAGTTLAGDVIEVAAGTYTEALLIEKALTINGPNAAVSPNGGSRVAEAIINLTGGSQIKIRTDNLSLKGFKIVNLNQQGAIVSGGTLSNTLFAANNVTIEKNLFDNLTGDAVYTYGSISNWTITDNKIQNVSSYTTGGTYGCGMGFWLGASNLTITNNTISNVSWEGIQFVCYGSTSASNILVQNNTITNVAHSGMNIACNLNNVHVHGNTITNANTSSTANEGGMIIQGLGTVVDAVISGNTISGNFNGIYVQDNLTGKDLVVTNNDLSGNTNKALKNDATGTLTATCNWYGTIVPATIAGMISGGVTYIPYNVTSSGPCAGGLPVLVKRSGVIINGYSTIQAAINAGTTLAGDVIEVAAGTYTENVIINKAVTLNGANADVAFGSRSAESIILPTSAGNIPVTIAADGVTFNGFELSATASPYALSTGGTGRSNMTVKYNYIHDVGTTLTNAYVHSIQYNVANSTATSNVTISYNKFDYINSLSNIRSGNAIGILQSTSTGSVSNLLIEHNTISHVYSGVRGAYGIIINVGSSAAGSAISPIVRFNNISILSGGWAHAIGLEGNTPGASVTNNVIDNLIATNPSDACAVMVEQNTGAATVGIHDNSFTNVAYGVINKVTAVVDAIHNYWGSTVAADVVARKYGNVNYTPWCDATFTNCNYSAPSTSPVLNQNDVVYFLNIQDAVNAASTNDVIKVLTGGTYAGVVFNTGVSMTLTNASTPPAIVTIVGASPALTVASGTVSVDGFNYTTATSDPTVLVSGGSLNMTNCTITESTGSTQSAIKVTGGTLNATHNTIDPGDGKGLTQTGGTATATGNYWGTTDAASIAGLMSGVVSSGYTPWCNSNFTICNIGTSIITNIGTPIATSCGNYDVHITVREFNNVGTISLKMTYPNSYLTYTGVTSSIPTAVYNEASGTFTYSYYGAAVNLAQDADLFVLHFTMPPSASGALTNFNWSTVSGDCEYATAGGADIFPATFNNLSNWAIPVRPVVNTNTGIGYCKIQDAIDAPATNDLITDRDVITVAAGTYPEHVIINKKLDIRGANYGISGNAARGAEALIVPEANLMPADPWTEVVYINSDDVSFNGFKVSGDNPAISGYSYAGMNLEKGQGVYSDRNNITFSNNIVENATTMGFYAGGTQSTQYQNLVVSNNKIDKIHDIGAVGYGFGFYIQGTAGTINNNVVTNVRNGIQVQPYRVMKGVTTPELSVKNNSFSAYKTGIYFNYSEVGASAWNFELNNISVSTPPLTPGAPLTWAGIKVETMYSTAYGGTITTNTINGTGATIGASWSAIYGMQYAGSNSNSDQVFFTNNIVSNVPVGFKDDASANIVFTGNNLSYTQKAIVVTGTFNVDATGGNTYNTVASNSASLAQLFDIEDAIDHKIDLATLGFVKVIPNNDYVTINSFIAPNTTPLIQRGIDAALATWTVNIADGLYKESNINVGKALNILGQSRAGAILSPSVADGNEDNAFTNASQAFIVKSSNVNIQKLTIDGNGNPALPGLNFRNGVITDKGDNYNTITANNITFKNLYRRGVCIYTKDAHATGMTISGNSFDNIGNGLSFESGAGIMVFDADAAITSNDITNCGNGIGTNYLAAAGNAGVCNISNNNISVDATQGVGLDISGLKGGSTISDNHITQGYYGIVPEYYTGTNVTPVTISTNTISGVKYGIYLYALDDAVKLLNNSITAPTPTLGSRGIYFANTYAGETPGATSKAQMDENIISGCEVGVDLGLNGTGSLYANTFNLNGIGVLVSGGGNLTSCTNNFITNNTVAGLKIASGAGTIGSITNNDLSGNPAGNAINNASSIISANCNWYGTETVAGVQAAITSISTINYDPWLVNGSDIGNPGFVPGGSCTGAVNLYVNDATLDGNDTYTTAIGSDANPGTNLLPFLTINKAVTKAVAGTHIWVDAGTFQEQVQIGKSLTITGNTRDLTIVKAPVSMDYNVAWNNAHPIIYAYGNANTINISKIAIDGDGGRTTPWFIGALYYDANGTFTNNKITSIHDAGGFSGAQAGHAFYGTQAGSLTQTLTISNNLVDDYQKGGIYVRGAGTSASITGNTVTGQNTPIVTAQNGICVMLGATATITGNTVENNIWNKVEHPHAWTASGILLYQSGISSVSGNILNGNEIALSSYQAAVGTSYGVNTFSNNKMHLWLDVEGDVNVGNIYDKTVLNPAIPEAVFGCIQYGIDEATAGAILNASAGTYKENVNVHTSVTLNGPQLDIDPTGISGRTGAEAVVYPATNDPSNGRVFDVNADNVTINGFTVDGDNPDISGGIANNGADINAEFGIGSGNWSTSTGGKNGMQVKYNIVKNFTDGCIYGNGASTPTEGGLFTYNRVDNSTWGIVMETNCYTDITYNKITRASRGIQFDNYWVAKSSGSALIDHNNITYTKRGILQNLAYGTASLFEIKNNTLTADATPEVANVGLLYWSIASGITATATNNTINAGENGARIWNCQGNVSINGGTINGGQIGVYATTTDAYGDGSNQNASINNVNIIGSIATGDIGVKVYSHLSGKTSSLTVTNNCNISGYDKGIYINGADASANIHDNSASITGNLVGLDIDAGTVSNLYRNKFSANETGVFVRNGGKLLGTTEENFINNNTGDNIKIDATAGTIGIIYHNDLSGYNASGYAINNLKASPQLVATCNWLGSTINTVNGNVSYIPSLSSNVDDGNPNNGFQPMGTCNPPTEFYVNDNIVDGPYTTAIGNDGNLGTSTSPFRTIQHAIDIATGGEIIKVDAGTYAEDIIVNKQLTIKGANFGVSPNLLVPARGAEAIIYPATSSPFGEIIKVRNSNVKIDGFTIDGDNPTLPSLLLGTDGLSTLNAAEAVTVYVDNVNNLTVTNNVIKNLTYYGVTIFGATYSAPMTSGHLVSDNLFKDLGTYTDPEPNPNNNMNFWGGGVLLYNNQYAAVTNNCMNNVRLGVQTGNFHRANTGTTTYQLIDNNTIQARRTGIFHNLHYSAASTYTQSNNVISALANANETKWDGIALSSLSVASISDKNTINGYGIIKANLTKAYEIWNVKSTFPATITDDGTHAITGVDYGVFANNYEGYSSDATDGAYANVSGLNITTNATGTGVRIFDSPSSTTHAPVRVSLSGCTINALEGVKFEETQAGTVGGSISSNIINAGAIGIDVNSLVTSVSNSLSITGNTINFSSQLAGTNPTVGMLLRKITGSAAATISGNNITGPFYGYMVYNMNTSTATTITGGTISGVMQGMSALNVDPLTGAFAASNFGINGTSMSGFAGSSTNPDINFQAGIYTYTGGSNTSAIIALAVNNVSVTGTGKIAQDCAGMSFADFSTGSGIRQNIAINTSTINYNLNRGINVRGANALVDINTSTLSGNGSNPYGLGGNEGFGIIVREGAIANVDNCFIVNPATVTSPYNVNALFTDKGTATNATINASNNSLSQNGNTTSWLANNGSGTLNATCNWWGITTPPSSVAAKISGVVTYVPWLTSGLDAGGNPADGFQPTVACVSCAIILTETHVDVTCPDAFNGSINLTVSGAVTPVAYLWTGPHGFSSTDEDPLLIEKGFYTVTVTADNGCTETITIEIKINDVVAPTLSCPNPITVNQHEARDPYYTGYATATDCSGTVTITYDDDRTTLDQCNTTGYITRTWTAKDIYNNTSHCHQVITVQDNDNPIIVVQADTTINTEAGICSAHDIYATPTATDFAYFQGFENSAWLSGSSTNSPSTDWNDYNSHVTRVASYGTITPNAPSTAFGLIDNVGATSTGAMTRLGGYNGTFGLGFISKVDVYLNMSDPAITAGTYGWDLDQAVSNNTGGFLRDFIFHVGGNSTGIYVCTSSNSNNVLPAMTPAYIQTQASYATITSSGWYTMEWETKNNGGFLSVVYRIRVASTGAIVWTNTVTTSDAIAGVGGNRYMWFNFVAADKLAIDNTSLVRKLTATPSPLSGTVFAKGPNTVNVTTTDACGHVGTNSFIITVEDKEIPVITCPSAVTKHMNSACTYVGGIGTATATDNCTANGNITITSNAPTAFNEGPTTVTWMADDGNGNTQTCTQTVTVIRNVLNGTLKYNNTPKTDLNGVLIEVKDDDGNTVGSTTTSTIGLFDGSYSIGGLCAGTFDVIMTISKAVGGINSTDAAQVNYWGTNPYTIDAVRFYSGDVNRDMDVTATDAQKIQRHFTFGDSFLRGDWAYWKTGDYIYNHSSPTDDYPQVSISGADLTTNFYAQCVGDFNMSFTPSVAKTSSNTLDLVYNGNKLVGSNQEFELPVRIVEASSVGAISLIMNFPSNLVDVQDVLLNGVSGLISWAVNGNELRIGWNSLTALNLAANEQMISLKLKTTAAFTGNQSIQFTLAADPLNELANAQYDVIGNAVLSMEVVEATLLNIEEAITTNNGLTLSNHPNPFNGSTMITYELPFDGKVTLELYNYLGSRVSGLVNEDQSNGHHSFRLDASSLAAGIYMAKLTVKNGKNEVVRTIKLVNHK